MFSSRFVLFPTLQKKIGVKKKKKIRGGGGGVVEFFFLEKQFFLISRFMLFSTLHFFFWKVPLHLLVKWEVVTPNSRGTVGIYIHYILYSLVLILYLKCGGGLGGGGGVMFSHILCYFQHF